MYTLRQYGPDRIAGFTVIPAMSQISYGAGTRFLQLIGGVALSFYDWYADLPPSSPQTFGDQTDVPESGDWFNSSYLIMWGSNIPVTRTPDAHFMAEARYSGTKVVVVSPDFADNTKFADEWCRLAPGTDGALAIAMGHVILSKFHVGEKEPFFLDYMRRFTDAPFLVTLDDRGDGTYTPGKFLTASNVSDPALKNSPNATHRLLMMQKDGTIVDPGGTLADRYGEEGVGTWTLNLDKVDPIIQASFRMEVDGLIDSEIMQLLPVNVAKDMVDALMNQQPDVDDEEAAMEAAQAAPPPSASDAEPASEPGAAAAEPANYGYGATPMQPHVASNVPVQSAQFTPLSSTPVQVNDANIGLILDVPLQVNVELGRTKKSIKDILDLTKGSIVELDKLAGEPVDIMVNGKYLAKGEVVVIDENFGVRITEIVSPLERAARLQ